MSEANSNEVIRNFHKFYEDWGFPMIESRDCPGWSYALYAPLTWEARDCRLVVLIHGSSRDIFSYLRAYQEAADKNGWILLLPLFPASGYTWADQLNYHLLSYGDIRYDEILLKIVDEVDSMLGTTSKRFTLGGFSGGGQFVHRFAYWYPERLDAVSVGAPGQITTIGDRRWPAGTDCTDGLFGGKPNIAELRRVPAQFIVGMDDTEPVPPAPEGFVDELSAPLENRIDVLRRLEENWRGAGIRTEIDIVPDTAHDTERCAPSTIRFFERELSGQADSTPEG